MGFGVSANVPWAIVATSIPSWITAAPKTGDGATPTTNVVLTFGENDGPMPRNADIIIRSTGTTPASTLEATVNVSQAVRALSAAPATLTLAPTGGTMDFDVSANVPWAIVDASIPAWITAAPKTGDGTGDGTITMTNVGLSFGENDTPNPRNAIIIIRSTGPSSVVKSVDATNHDIEATVNVSQAPLPILGLPALTNDVRIFPNPASTHLYIEGIAQETVLTIHTFSGTLLLRNFLTQESSVDLRSVPEGAYILTLKGSQGVRRQRLIKSEGQAN